jgi:electron-transferring-flavoprotein dehydrogenase
MDRETLEVDVLIVGAGPAGLAAALRLAARQRAAGTTRSVAVLEKGREPGAHSLSGAVLDPSALAELLPDCEARGAPLGVPVTRDRIYYLTPRGAWRSPIVPPPLRNHGHRVISLSRLVAWLGVQAEDAGVDVLTGFAGQDVLFDGDRVAGVRTGERGRARDGREKPAFEPGVDVRAAVTVLCDGVRGNLTRAVVARCGLDAGRAPQQYALGLKERWSVPAGRIAEGEVVHTLGHPLGAAPFGGGFLYGLEGGDVAVGLVAGLDYEDPRFDPHDAFNRFKQHPLVAGLLAGGELRGYGAKALPEGGWHAVPRPYADGVLLAGDAAGLLDSLRLKGIHLAMRSGMLAADAAFDALEAGDTSTAGLARYGRVLAASAVRRELYPARHVRQAFGWGLVPGLLYAGLALVTGGRVPGPVDRVPGHARMRHAAGSGTPPSPEVRDVGLWIDRRTDVHHSGTAHDEDQPAHLLVDTDVCHTSCGDAYGHPCLRFCPAEVYEMVDEGQGLRLRVNASNCVHCKTCEVMDPYQAIRWVPPEGGDGPRFTGL